MALKRKKEGQKQTFTLNINVEVPREGSTKTDNESFKATFRWPTQTEFETTIDRDLYQSQFVKVFLESAEDIEDEDGNKLLEQEAIDAVLEHSMAVVAMYDGFIKKYRTGSQKARSQ